MIYVFARYHILVRLSFVTFGIASSSEVTYKAISLRFVFYLTAVSSSEVTYI